MESYCPSGVWESNYILDSPGENVKPYCLFLYNKETQKSLKFSATG